MLTDPWAGMEEEVLIPVGVLWPKKFVCAIFNWLFSLGVDGTRGWGKKLEPLFL
jgi:hypothetical protein